MTPLASASLDRAIVAASQKGLPLVARPFAEIAAAVGTGEAQVMDRMKEMAARGVIRRIAAVPNHYALGLRFNGMTVWDVEDSAIGALGPKVGALPFVTHCYRRPRADGVWPYNLFAMVHGQSRDEALAKAEEIRALLGDACQGHDILFSTRILKKTGFRLQA